MCSADPSFAFPHLLSWPPRSSPWFSCGRQQPERWAAPADTRRGQQLPIEPPGGTRCSDLKQRAQGEEREGRRGGEQRRESIIIYSWQELKQGHHCIIILLFDNLPSVLILLRRPQIIRHYRAAEAQMIIYNQRHSLSFDFKKMWEKNRNNIWVIRMSPDGR